MECFIIKAVSNLIKLRLFCLDCLNILVENHFFQIKTQIKLVLRVFLSDFDV